MAIKDPNKKAKQPQCSEQPASSSSVGKILKKITEHYLNSGDFNGILITNLGRSHETTRRALEELLRDGKIVLNFGDRHENPYILALEPEPTDVQLKKLLALKFQKPKYIETGAFKIQTNSVGCCAYPSRSHLQTVVDERNYQGRPYTLALALGEPQLSHRAFNLRILEFYRNDPRFTYETNDIQGSIEANTEDSLDASDQTLLKSFGFAYDPEIKNRYVAVYLRYLSKFTPEHQQRWKLEECSAQTLLHPDYARMSAGIWPEKQPIFTALCEELRVINEMAIRVGGKPLFKTHDKPHKFGFLVRPTKEEYEGFVHLLDKLMSDNLNKEFFEGKVKLKREEKRGTRVYESHKGTIVLLTEWLNNNVRLADPTPKDEMFKVFKRIREERAKPAHHLRENEWNTQFFAIQRELVIAAYDAVRTLRQILALHPATQFVEVPGWLYEGEIWTY